MNHDDIREWLKQVPTKLLLSEVGRRNNARRKVFASGTGRPKVLRKCPKCAALLGAREILKHKCLPVRGQA
jgi:hypothetical protein